jgi:rod shape-determining protein MreD
VSRGADAAKAAVLLFVAAILQVSILDRIVILHGTPDLLLVTLVSLALLRGSLFGAAGGFFSGLIVDTAALGTLGLTSLLLTLAGYWTGRYGETTGRDRVHAPFLSVAVVTVLVSVGQLVLHFMIGDHVSARLVLLDALAPTIVLNLILTPPVYALCRRLFRPASWGELSTEVRLLG